MVESKIWQFEEKDSKLFLYGLWKSTGDRFNDDEGWLLVKVISNSKGIQRREIYGPKSFKIHNLTIFVPYIIVLKFKKFVR